MDADDRRALAEFVGRWLATIVAAALYGLPLALLAGVAAALAACAYRALAP